jgi:hypothetical protein
MIGSMFGLVIIIASYKASTRLIVLRFPLYHILPLGSRLLRVVIHENYHPVRFADRAN